MGDITKPDGATYNPGNKTSLEDNELVRIIVENNDSRLFGLLYDRYAQAVFRKCQSFVYSKEEAQDLTHDLFLKLFFNLKKFKGQARFSTWLYSFTYNFCVNHVQRKVKKEKSKFQHLSEIDDFPEEEIDDKEIYKLKAEKLQLALQKLEAKDKMVLLMKYEDELSLKDMMEQLQVGESAVKMRINRAKKRLIDIYNNVT